MTVTPKRVQMKERRTKLLGLLEEGHTRTAAELGEALGCSVDVVKLDVRKLIEDGTHIASVRGPGGGFWIYYPESPLPSYDLLGNPFSLTEV